jgi:hypothetical protein
MLGMSSSHLVFDSRDEPIPSHVWLEGQLMWSHPHKSPRGMWAVRDELIYDFFEDEIIPDSLTLVPDAEGRLPTKHHKKWDDYIPSLIQWTKHTLSLSMS